MTNFQRMDIKNQEQRKVKEKVVLKDFLNKGPISLHPVIFTQVHFMGKLPRSS